ncbi:hypothetical protein [Paludibacter jiangxiensis]|nr:hypothetical protein [Paludibacter jiangxiensis]
MKTNILIAILCIYCGNILLAQEVTKPKKIRAKGDYIHCQTMTAFPEQFETYLRQDIYAFNKGKTNIGVNYQDKQKETTISIYVYPAPPAMEYRLRDEYFTCLQSIVNTTKQGIDFSAKVSKISKDNYKLMAISASAQQANSNTVLMLFECGKYFMKYRISSNKSDTSTLRAISNKLIERFSPTEIVKHQPLKPGTTIHVAPAVIEDTIGFAPIMAAALAKSKWANEEVDSLEKCSGFPSLYFEEQKRALTDMLDRWENAKKQNTRFQKYFNELSLIRDNGFLDEFIYDQYNGILLLPSNLKLNLEKYEVWKQQHKTAASLVGPIFYYLVGYEESYKQESK